jgi:hypothetical protein
MGLMIAFEKAQKMPFVDFYGGSRLVWLPRFNHLLLVQKIEWQ